MKNSDIMNQMKQHGWNIKKLSDVNAKIVFYTGDTDDYIGVRIFLPKIVMDQVEKAKRAGNFNIMEVEDDTEKLIKFMPDGTATLDCGFVFFKEDNE